MSQGNLRHDPVELLRRWHKLDFAERHTWLDMAAEVGVFAWLRAASRMPRHDRNRLYGTVLLLVTTERLRAVAASRELAQRWSDEDSRIAETFGLRPPEVQRDVREIMTRRRQITQYTHARYQRTRDQWNARIERQAVEDVRALFEGVEDE